MEDKKELVQQTQNETEEEIREEEAEKVTGGCQGHRLQDIPTKQQGIG